MSDRLTGSIDHGRWPEPQARARARGGDFNSVTARFSEVRPRRFFEVRPRRFFEVRCMSFFEVRRMSFFEVRPRRFFEVRCMSFFEVRRMSFFEVRRRRFFEVRRRRFFEVMYVVGDFSKYVVGDFLGEYVLLVPPSCQHGRGLRPKIRVRVLGHTGRARGEKIHRDEHTLRSTTGTSSSTGT